MWIACRVRGSGFRVGSGAGTLNPEPFFHYMKRRVVVTGIGAVTSLSCKVDDLWQKILRGQSGVHALKVFDTNGHKVRFGGDIYDWSTEGYIDRKEEKRIDRFTQFAMVAGIDAVTDS